MFTLTLNKSNFYKVKAGQNAEQISKTLEIPVQNKIFSGKIIIIPKIKLIAYKVKVGESYQSISNKFGVDSLYLSEINDDVLLYPTKIIYVPKK